MDWTFKFTDLAIVFATLAGPVIAVQLQKFLERRGEEERRQVVIYRSLMATRANPNSPQYVDALNAVPLEFHKIKPVMDAYGDYLAHLNTSDNGQLMPWNMTRQARFVELLKAMGKALRYNFRDAELHDHIYLPTWQLTLQNEQEIVRKGLVALMSGTPLPMKVTGFHVDPEVQKNQTALQHLLIEWLEGTRSPTVSIATPSEDKQPEIRN